MIVLHLKKKFFLVQIIQNIHFLDSNEYKNRNGDIESILAAGVIDKRKFHLQLKIHLKNLMVLFLKLTIGFLVFYL